MISGKGFTGRHMLAIMLAFFGVVIAVNVVMATVAVRTFGGTVVDNSYVASQRFNRWLAEGRAQDRLGWTARVRLEEGRRIRVDLSDRSGPLGGAGVEAVARHPLGRAADVTLRLAAAGNGVYVSQETLPAGRWLVHLEIRRGANRVRMIETLS